MSDEIGVEPDHVVRRLALLDRLPLTAKLGAVAVATAVATVLVVTSAGKTAPALALPGCHPTPLVTPPPTGTA